MGLADIVSPGNIMTAIIWFAITTGVIAGISYYKKED
jgi:hypothetical protein